MRIAYLSRGHSVYDYRFLEKMVERGHQPILISYFPSEQVQVAGVLLLHYDTDRLLHFPRLTSFQVAWHLQRVLKELNPDVLHTGWVNDCGFYGALSGFHPVLSMPWGSDILVVPEQVTSARWIARFVLRRADRITCDCQVVKTKIIQLSGLQPEKVIVIPWGINLGIFRRLSRPSSIRDRLGWQENQVLIMTRNFKSIYGIEYFIEALPSVVQLCPTVRVILVGSGPLESDLRAQISRLNLEAHVYFAGSVNEATMSEYLNAADVYVTTSLSDGTSASMLEAMACGLPVVVSDAPAYFEWIKDGVNGFIVSRKNSFALADRLVTLLRDQSLRTKMGNCNVEITHEFADWERNFSRFESIYQSLTCRRR